MPSFSFLLSTQNDNKLEILIEGNDNAIAIDIGDYVELNDPRAIDIVAMIRDVADQELARAVNAGASWRVRFAQIAALCESAGRGNTPAEVIEAIESILEEAGVYEPAAAEPLRDDRVAMTPAGDACQRYREALEQIRALDFVTDNRAVLRAVDIASDALEGSK